MVSADTKISNLNCWSFFVLCVHVCVCVCRGVCGFHFFWSKLFFFNADNTGRKGYVNSCLVLGQATTAKSVNRRGTCWHVHYCIWTCFPLVTFPRRFRIKPCAFVAAFIWMLITLCLFLFLIFFFFSVLIGLLFSTALCALSLVGSNVKKNKIK